MTESSRQRIKYIVSDYISCNIAWCVFNIIRYFTLSYNYKLISLGYYYSMPAVVLGQLLFPILMVALYAVSGYYNNVLNKASRIDEFINTYGIAFITSVTIFFIAIFNDALDDRLHNYELFLILWLLISTITFVPRLLLTNALNKRIRSGDVAFNTLIVGNNDAARQLAYELEHKYPHMGIRVVGFIDDAASMSSITDDRYQVIPLAECSTSADRLQVRNFIIMHDSLSPNHTVGIINNLLPLGRSIYITPDTLHFITSRPRTQMVAGEVLIDITKSNIPASTLNIKRISDIVISTAALIVLSPLLGLLALMVKNSSPGPIIYRQQRVGLNKKLFNIYKFRTMYVDSEANGPALSSDNDPRITHIGRFMRKYRLDELPQFFNVIKGDMSIVGPRPEREFYLNQIIEKAPYYSLLQQVRPGITSWGMVKFGYASNVDQMIERAKYDLLYIDNVSMIVDLKILLYTIRTVLTGKGV